jgi:hypothetical protein
LAEAKTQKHSILVSLQSRCNCGSSLTLIATAAAEKMAEAEVAAEMMAEAEVVADSQLAKVQ